MSSVTGAYDESGRGVSAVVGLDNSLDTRLLNNMAVNDLMTQIIFYHKLFVGFIAWLTA